MIRFNVGATEYEITGGPRREMPTGVQTFTSTFLEQRCEQLTGPRLSADDRWVKHFKCGCICTTHCKVQRVKHVKRS